MNLPEKPALLRKKLLWRPVLWVATAYGALIYLMLPPEVFVVNDDFGYLRSVIGTLQRGRPWTGDWLGPWSATLAVFSALVFKISGSMHTATSGLQAIYAAAALGGATRLFRDRGLSQTASLVFATFVISMPTLLWKSLEYTGITLYLPCLLWALWAAEKRRWGWFFVLWFVAFASRQSAVTWLVLPAVAGMRGFFSATSRNAGWRVRLATKWRGMRGLFPPTQTDTLPETDSPWRQPMIVLIGAVAAFALLALGMNKTQSQAMVTDHLWEQLHWGNAARSFVFGTVAFLAFAGIGAFTLSWGKGGAARFRPWKILGILAVGALLWTMCRLSPWVPFLEHESYSGLVGATYIKLLFAIALVGWMIGCFAIRWEMVVAGLGSLALVCLRNQVWDYYFMDIALFGFCALVARPASCANEDSPSWPKFAAIPAVILFVFFHSYFVVQFKLSIDRDYAVCTLAEKSLRNGRLDVTELSFAPGGFVGWHLHPYFVAHDGKNDPDITGFIRYLRENAAGVQFSPVRFRRDSLSLRPDRNADGRTPIASEIFPVCGLWSQRCSLLRNPQKWQKPPKLRLDAARYQPVPFPLNRNEWLLMALASEP